jgi:hypothetical protein
MKEFSKEKAYEEVQQQLALCTIEDAHHSAAVIIVDEKNNTVKVFGLNMDESELPSLLLEAASNVVEVLSDLLKSRTIQ